MKSYKIYNSKLKILKGIAPTLIVFIAAICALIYGNLHSNAIITVISAVIAFFAFVIILPHIGPLLTRKPFFSFDEDGINVSGSRNIGKLPWKQIDRMGAVKIRGFYHIGFAIKDYKTYKKNLTSFQMATVDQNRRQKLPHVCVNFAYSKNDITSVYPVLKEFYIKYK